MQLEIKASAPWMRQASSLNRLEARAYSRRHSRRLMVTTMQAITSVAASSTRKFPLSVAWLITAPRPIVDMVCPRKWKYSATMLAFQAPAGSRDQSCNQVRENCRQQQPAPPLHAAQMVDIADFLQVGGNGRRPGNDVEQDVPLRSQQQQDNRADAQSASHANQHQQDDGEQRRRGNRGGDLRDGLCNRRKPGMQPNYSSHRNGPERRQNQGKLDAKKSGSSSQQDGAQLRQREPSRSRSTFLSAT